MDDRPDKKGVKTRLLGIVLIILGVLDSLLALRGGLTLNSFYTALIGSGLLLFIIGTIRGGRSTDATS